MSYSSMLFPTDCNGNIDIWLMCRHLHLIRNITSSKTLSLLSIFLSLENYDSGQCETPVLSYTEFVQLSNTLKRRPAVKDKNTSVSASVSMKQGKTGDCGYLITVFVALNLRNLAASWNSELHNKVEELHDPINSLTVHSQLFPSSLFLQQNQSDPDLRIRTQIIQAIKNEKLFSRKRKRKITFFPGELKKPMDVYTLFVNMCCNISQAQIPNSVEEPLNSNTQRNSSTICTFLSSKRFTKKKVLCSALTKAENAKSSACSVFSVPSSHANSVQFSQIPLGTLCKVHTLAFESVFERLFESLFERLFETDLGCHQVILQIP